MEPIETLNLSKDFETQGKNHTLLRNTSLCDLLYDKGFICLPKIKIEVIESLRKYFFETFPEVERLEGNLISILHPDTVLRRKCNNYIIEKLSPYLDSQFKNYKIILATYFAKPMNQNNVVGFHQDPTFTDPASFDDFTIWIPLENIFENEGQIQIIPYTHKTGNRINFFSLRPDYLDHFSAQQSITLNSEVGEPIMFFNRTIHASAINKKKKVRVAISIKICQENATIYSYFNSNDSEKVQRYVQKDDFYLNPLWNDKEFPKIGTYDGIVSIW